MSKTFKTGINWTKLAVALLLVCSILGLNAMAQTTPEEPLDAEAATALLDDLKGGLPDLIDDEAQVTAITEKWDAHEDLAGKTKTQILKLLFADVKAVVEDKEAQNNIWKSWVEEEKSDEETPVETPQAPVSPPVNTPQPVNPPAKPVEQSTCRPNGTSVIKKSNQAEKFGFISVSYSPLFATGTVRCFDEKKGFGFIIPDDGGTDLFVHFTAINMDGFRTLQEGQKVQYEINIGPKGQRTAVNVRAA